ncbi:TonB-dependent receptor, partial [bacterium]|nr:TonB-dependent receptor [bacterium]
MRKLGLFFIALLILCVFAGFPAYAQVGSATVTGTVKDDQGNPLPGASVSAKNTETGFERVDVTDDNGVYRIPSLPFGSYDMTAKIEGFATQVQKGVRLDVGKTTPIDFGMKLSTTAETMEITGETPLIERTESHVSTVVTPEQVENLPLNGRQFANLAALAPGTTLGFHPDPTRPTNLAVSSIGGSGRNVNVSIDGGDNNDDTVGGLNQMFSLESIAEFNYLQNRYKAEYGRSSGGILNVVTKSGTNDPHGSFFSLFRDDSLNSLSTSEENAGLSDPTPFSREHYGGSIGGPIVKDRAHFFAAVERLQDDVESIVDTQGIAPELDGPLPVPTRDTQVTAKFTSNLNPQQYLSVRYGYQKSTSVYGAATYNTETARGTLTNKFNSVLATHNYVISDDMLNEFTFQYADFANSILPTSNDPSLIFPSGIYIGQNINTPQTTNQKKYQFKDDLSWSWRGNHHFKGGLNFVHEPTLGGSFSTGVT